MTDGFYFAEDLYEEKACNEKGDDDESFIDLYRILVDKVGGLDEEEYDDDEEQDVADECDAGSFEQVVLGVEILTYKILPQAVHPWL